jgi:hypothetical protein
VLFRSQALRVAVMPYRARRPPPAECHFYFAHRVSFLSCADSALARTSAKYHFPTATPTLVLEFHKSLNVSWGNFPDSSPSPIAFSWAQWQRRGGFLALAIQRLDFSGVVAWYRSHGQLIA